jgi:uncharacterized protein (TIGR02271 family)
MAELNDRIVPLDELDDFDVAEGDPDVRGWDVIGADGRKIGEVDQLLVDTEAMKVRYLDVDLDDDLLEGNDQDRHILIPIGYARLDEDDDHVIVDQLDTAQIGAIPAYTHQPITRDFETSLRDRFNTDREVRADTTARTDATEREDFYGDNLYDENRFFGARRNRAEGDERRLTLSEEELDVGRRDVRAGEVELRKEVESRHVREDVPLRREEVVVERRPATPGMSASPRIEEGEIHVPVSREEAVVQKRVVPTEEVVVMKREVVENEPVEADLRRERVDFREEGDVRLRTDDEHI